MMVFLFSKSSCSCATLTDSLGLSLTIYSTNHDSVIELSSRWHTLTSATQGPLFTWCCSFKTCCWTSECTLSKKLVSSLHSSFHSSDTTGGEGWGSCLSYSEREKTLTHCVPLASLPLTLQWLTCGEQASKADSLPSNMEDTLSEDGRSHLQQL